MKTYSLLWDAIVRCAATAGHRGLFLTRHWEQMQGQLHECAPLLKQTSATINVSRRTVGFPNGSVLEFGHLLEPGQEEKYSSSEFSFVDLYQDAPAHSKRFLHSRERVRVDLAPNPQR